MSRGKSYLPAQAQRTGIETQLGFFPLAFLLLFCAPVVEINGIPHRLSWGTHFFDLPPGRYLVRVYFGYLWMPQCGANHRDVILEPGVIRQVRYFMWPWMFAPGEMSVY